jgi:hypothetical protein
MKNEIPETFSGFDHRRFATRCGLIARNGRNNNGIDNVRTERDFNRARFGQLALLLQLNIGFYSHSAFAEWTRTASIEEIKRLMSSTVRFKHLERTSKAVLTVVDVDTLRLSLIK